MHKCNAIISWALLMLLWSHLDEPKWCVETYDLTHMRRPTNICVCVLCLIFQKGNVFNCIPCAVEQKYLCHNWDVHLNGENDLNQEGFYVHKCKSWISTGQPWFFTIEWWCSRSSLMQIGWSWQVFVFN